MPSLVLSLAAAAGSLSLGGECGAIVSLDAVSLTPGGRARVVSGSAFGSTTLASGACAGTTLGLDGPIEVLGNVRVDAAGEVHLSRFLAAPDACGLPVQLVDVATCAPTNVAVVPGEDADGDGFPTTRDCDDTDPATYPGALERCDGRQNDCSAGGWTGDDGVVTWYGADGSVVDLTPTFAGGTPDSPATVTLDHGDGELAVCAGTYEVGLLTGPFAGDVAVHGPDGSAATALRDVSRFDGHTGTLDLEGLTFLSGVAIGPPRPEVSMNDITLSSLTFQDRPGAPGSLDVRSSSLDRVALNLRDGAASAQFTDTGLGDFSTTCTSTATRVTLRDTHTPAGATDSRLRFERCTVALERVEADPLPHGLTLLSSQATATDLTIRGASQNHGIEVITALPGEPSTLDGTRVVVEDTRLYCLASTALPEALGTRSTVALRDSVLRGCGSVLPEGSPNTSVAVGATTLDLIDTVVETGSPAHTLGLSLGTDAAVTCRKEAAASAGVVGHVIGAILGRGSRLESQGCDWSNASDVVLLDPADPLEDYTIFDYPDDATFLCTNDDLGMGGCVP